MIDTTQYRAYLQRAVSRLRKESYQALEQTVEHAATLAKTSALYRHDGPARRRKKLDQTISGQLFSSIKGRVVAKARHASFVEEGTRPHLIVPRRKQALRFVQNGAIRFAQFVSHPGTKPRPFMMQARDRAQPMLERLLLEAAMRAFS